MSKDGTVGKLDDAHQKARQRLHIHLENGEAIMLPIKGTESAGEVVAGLHGQGGIWMDAVLIPWHRVHKVEIVRIE